SGASPTVARSVDQHADGAREASGDERVAHIGVVGGFVDVGVPLVEGGRAHRLTVDLLIGGHERLSRRRIVGGVADETIHTIHTGGCALDRVADQGHGGLEVAGPAEPAIVGDIDVVVYVRDRMQLVQRVVDALHVSAAGVRLSAFGDVQVGD